MTTAQRLQIRASEIRQRLNAISGLDDLTDEVRAESDRLTGEFRDVETKLRAALVAEGDEAERRAAGLDTEDAEQRERRELRGRAQLHRFVSAAIERRGVDGAEAEYAAAENCGGLVPLSLFGPTAERARGRIPRPAERRRGTSRRDAGGVQRERATEPIGGRSRHLRSVGRGFSWRRDADRGGRAWRRIRCSARR